MEYNGCSKRTGERGMKDDFEFLRLWDLYSPLLTATQREITNLYFNCDLSLGEIAEEKGVSRQSVSDCLQKCRKQLENYESKLGFAKALEDVSREYSAYMTETERWIARAGEKYPALAVELGTLRAKLDGVHQAFGAETIETERGVIVGKAFREGN